MKIGTREVGPGQPTFVIAECGSNHGGSLDAALALIDAAADAGADAAKFQYFRVDRFLVARKNVESLRKYELPDAWLPALKARCDRLEIEFLCTAFDLESLDVVDPFVNAHKIGSYEAGGMGTLTQAVRATGKPFFLSHGRIVGTVRYGNDIPLRCVSEYPAPVKGYLRGPFAYSQPWGVSDHTLDPLTVPCAAVALGACVVEKHMRMDEVYIEGDGTLSAPDWAHSISPGDFERMVHAIRLTESAIR